MSSGKVVVIGGGPAGLMAAETLGKAGIQVDVFDAMPSVCRKFLLAGKGGLNLTHSEPKEKFLTRYGAHQASLQPFLKTFGANELREWVHELGIETFVGSSGRVFPTEMKAAPLVRTWLHRLRIQGVKFHVRHYWLGWTDEGRLKFATPGGEVHVDAAAVVLALGGGSWPQLGSDGSWVNLLKSRHVKIAPLRATNCGFDTFWTEYFHSNFAGKPLKSVAITFTTANGNTCHKQGELMITETGVEGSLIYTLSSKIRDEIEKSGKATIYLDLMPAWDLQKLIEEIAKPRGSRSLSSHLYSRLRIKGVKAALLRERLTQEEFSDPVSLAKAIKALQIKLIATRPIEEAISSAGGISFKECDKQLMIKKLQGVFCAGEMLDWEAPTGGYLLTACFASGVAAGKGVLDWLSKNNTEAISEEIEQLNGTE